MFTPRVTNKQIPGETSTRNTLFDEETWHVWDHATRKKRFADKYAKTQGQTLKFTRWGTAGPR
jgi:hypothetical protein